MDQPNTRLRRTDLYNLFATAAFFIHAWAFFLVFNDIAWITDRTNSWDALGVVAYALVFALIESLIFFAFILLSSLFLPRKWDATLKTAFLGSVVVLIAFWAVVSQLFFLHAWTTPAFILSAATGSSHPIRAASFMILIPVLISIAFPLFFIIRSEKLRKALNDLFERITTLSTLYLFFDFAALLLIIYRNLRI